MTPALDWDAMKAAVYLWEADTSDWTWGHWEALYLAVATHEQIMRQREPGPKELS